VKTHAEMSSHGVVIVNAGSGAGGHDVVAARIGDVFKAQGIDAAVALVAGRDVARTARRALEDGVSLVIAAGGDGTIGTVASVVTGTAATLGVLPLGTLNHFAKDLHIPLDLEGAARTIAGGHAIAIDVGEVNGRSFINNASIGLYARLVWEREKERRGGHRKWVAVAVAAARLWQHYRRVRVTVRTDDRHRVVRTPFVFVGNNEYQLDGLQLGGRTRLDGGSLQVLMAPGMTRMELVGVLLAAFTGRLHGEDHLDSLTASEVSIEAWRRRIGVSLDGELWIARTPLSFRIRPGALRVLVPAPVATP